MSTVEFTESEPRVSLRQRLDAHPWIWLSFAVAATAAGHMRWGIDCLAFLAPIAWLRYASTCQGRRGWATFVVAYLGAWTLVVLGIVTAPLEPAMALMFSLPIGVMLMLPYLAWAGYVRRRGRAGGWATLLFPAAMVLAETFAHRCTPFGVWGHAANTALGDLPLMQLAALTGATGIGFMLNWLAAAIESRTSEVGGQWAHRRQLWLAIAAFVCVHVYGDLRLDFASSRGVESVTVAAVGTDCTLAGLPLPESSLREAWDATLFERTERAARGGAQLVVWTEAASVVLAQDEPAWLEAVGELAQREQVAIVAGYVVPGGTGESFHYENAYALFRPDGGLEHRYLKHYPVPGEPAVRGTGPAPMWTSEALGELSGAICYDYDFPASALERSHADLVALPSSDWRGIDPIHTHMARLRAIEGGHALLRSTRYGLSAGIDAFGVVRGQMSAFDDGDPILWVDLPREGRDTLYARWGEWFALLCGVLVCMISIGAWSRRD